MKKLGFALFVFLLTSSSLFADATPVEVKCDFTSYGSENDIAVSYNGEAENGYWQFSGAGSGTRMMSMVPGEEYLISLEFFPTYGSYGYNYDYSTYSLSLSTPSGYRLMMTGPNGTEFKESLSYYQSAYSWNIKDFLVTLVPVAQFSNGSADFGQTNGFSDHRPNLSIDLGPLQYGGNAGTLKMDKEFFSELVYTPADLEYISISPEVSVFRSSGKIRQIAAPAGLVDVVTLNSTTYRVSMYDWSSVGSFNGSTYSVSGPSYAIHSYELKKLGTNSLQLKKTSGSFVNSTVIERSGNTVIKYDWTSGGASPKTHTLRKLETAVSTSGSEETRTVKKWGRTTSTGSFVEAERTRLKYKTFGAGSEAWGPVLTEREEGYGFNHSIKTTYVHYVNSTDDGYRNLKSETRYEKNGPSYVTRYSKLYEYYGTADGDKVGLLKKTYEPFLDTLPSFGSSNGNVTSYSYSSIRYDERVRLNLVETKVNGSTVGKTSYSYDELSGGVLKTLTQDYVSSGSSVSTESMNYLSTHSTAYLKGRQYSVKRPDGTKTRFLYSLSGSNLVIDEYGGYASNPSGYSGYAISGGNGPTASYKFYVVPKQSTQTRTIVDSKGRLVSVASKVCSSGATFSTVYTDTFGYQSGGFLSSVKRDGTTTYDAFWENGKLSTSTDASGKITDYEYDSNGRLESIIEVGASATTVGSHGYATDAVVEAWTEIDYDGANNETRSETKAIGTSEVLVSTFVYDKTGMLTSKTRDCCDTVSYVYVPGQITTTNADGGTVVEVYWKDGSLKSRTGTATIPLYAKTFINSNQVVSQSAAQAFTSIGELKIGFRQERIDWLGRPIATQVRNAKGTLTESVNTYDSVGRLSSTRPYKRNGGSLTALTAATRYTYNSIGQPYLQGLDVENNGSLGVTSATDRISSKHFEYWKDGASKWWAVEKVFAYPSASGAVLASESRSRLSHYSGELASTLQKDSQGNATTTISFVNRSVGMVEVESIFDPAGSGALFTESVAVSRLGRTVYSKSSSNAASVFKYDSLGRLTESKERANVRKVYSYHNGTRRLYQIKESSNGSGGLKTIRQYDYTHARVTKETRFNGSSDGGNAISYYAYNQRGQRTHAWGPGTNPLKLTFDGYGRQQNQYQYRDSITGTSFSDSGKAYSRVYWHYGHSDGSLSQKRHYDGGSYKAELFEFNELGQIDKRTTARSTSIYADFVYSIGGGSSTGDLTSVNYSDATPDESYTYDRMGRPFYVGDVTGTRIFNYAALNGLGLAGELLADGFYGSGSSRDISYSYETAGGSKVPGRYSSVTYDGVSWSQSYDAANGRISSVNALGSGFSSTMAFVQGYHAGSDIMNTAYNSATGYKQERALESWSNKIWHSKTHWGGSVPAHFRTLSITTQNQITNSQLDGNSSSSSLVAKIRGGSTSAINYNPDYDVYGQVDDWNTSRTSGVESNFAWDAAGNPTSYGGASYVANSLNEMDPAASGDQWSYDGDGNLTNDGTWSYQYDANNRLRRMSKTGQSLEFVYDYMGRRVQKKVWNNSSYSGTPAKYLRFVYQGMELLAELDSGGDVDKSFHWGLDRSNTRGGAGGNMGLLMWRDHNTNKSYFPAYDLSGNVSGLLDDNGTFVAWYEHDPFGRVITEGGAMKDANPIRFATQYVDDESGLAYYGLRYYDPGKGRFINRDPIGESGGMNLYQFVNNDPVQGVDVWGLKQVFDPNCGDFLTTCQYLEEGGGYGYLPEWRCTNTGVREGCWIEVPDDTDVPDDPSPDNGGSGGNRNNPAQKENEEKKPWWKKKLCDGIAATLDANVGILPDRIPAELQASVGTSGTLGSTFTTSLHGEVNGGISLNLNNFLDSRFFGHGQVAWMPATVGFVGAGSVQASGGISTSHPEQGFDGYLSGHGEGGVTAGFLPITGGGAVDVPSNLDSGSMSVSGKVGFGEAYYVAGGVAGNVTYHSATVREKLQGLYETHCE